MNGCASVCSLGDWSEAAQLIEEVHEKHDGPTFPWEISMPSLLPSGENRPAQYQTAFLVDTGATDSMAPASELARVGIKPAGTLAYELADGRVVEYEFGLAQIESMGEITAGRVIFGPDDAEPLLGVTQLESAGLIIDPRTGNLKRLPAIPLKHVAATA